MTDLTSRDDERTAEQARLKGIEEEKQRQRELESAKDQARKEGADKAQMQEREKEQARKEGAEKGRMQEKEKDQSRVKEKGSSGAVKIILGIVLLIIIILAIAWLTLNVSVTAASPALVLPFTSTYAVTFPEGQTVTVGSSHISVLSYQNELISNIDNDRQKLVVGEDRVISERRAVITTLGKITVLDTDFQITLKYKGERDNLAYFDMAVQTSQQVPDILLRQLLPAEIHAQPV